MRALQSWIIQSLRSQGFWTIFYVQQNCQNALLISRVISTYILFVRYCNKLSLLCYHSWQFPTLTLEWIFSIFFPLFTLLLSPRKIVRHTGIHISGRSRQRKRKDHRYGNGTTTLSLSLFLFRTKEEGAEWERKGPRRWKNRSNFRRVHFPGFSSLYSAVSLRAQCTIFLYSLSEFPRTRLSKLSFIRAFTYVWTLKVRMDGQGQEIVRRPKSQSRSARRRPRTI